MLLVSFWPRKNRHGEIKYVCKSCDRKGWHSFVENRTVIRAVPKGGRKPRRGVYSCNLHPQKYYLAPYGKYKCQNCGHTLNLPLRPQRLSAEDYEKIKDDYKTVSNARFWGGMYGREIKR